MIMLKFGIPIEELIEQNYFEEVIEGQQGSYSLFLMKARKYKKI